MASDAPDNVVAIRRSGRSRPVWQWPIVIVLIGVGVAMSLIALDFFRRGSVILSASVLLAAFLRLMLPDSEAGMLAVRSRRVDVATLLVLGVGLTVFTFWVPAPS